MADRVLLVVDDDDARRDDVGQELEDRYGRHYRTECLSRPADVSGRLEEIARAGDEVALVLAAQWLDGSTGIDVLAQVRRCHPQARRGLVLDWGDWGQGPTGDALFEGIAQGSVDHYVLRPGEPPDELFHQTISGMLLDWAEASLEAPHTIHVVGDSWSGRAYELREALQACAIPHTFCLADSDQGRQLMADNHTGPELPVMIFPNGHILRDPSNIDIALAAGAPVAVGSSPYDLVVVGAGPAGLSAAVYGASEGLGTLVVDRGGIGGQATSSSLIRNYLGFPRGVTGRQLARSAYDQAWLFGAQFAFMHTVDELERDADGLVLRLSEGQEVHTTAVLLAMGASWRRLGVPSLEALTGSGVYYGGSISEAPAQADREVFVVGGANSAGQAVLHLARYARHATIVVRADSLRAGMSDYLVRQVEATENITVRCGTQVVDGGGHGQLERLVLRDVSTGADETVDADALFLMIGAEPYTAWLPSSVELDERGFVRTGAGVSTDRWPLERPPFDLESSLPGVFAAGDARAGSVKRVASAVGEGSIAVQLVHQLLAVEGREPRGRPPVPAG